MRSRNIARHCESVFVQESPQDVSVWNRNLQSWFGNGLFEKVLLLYWRMQAVGVRPNASTFPSVLGSCLALSDLRLGEVIHAQILRCGCDSDSYVGSSLVHMYGKFQGVDSAWQVFDKLPVRSVISWTSMIQAYARIGRSSKAVEMFKRMQRDDEVRPNAITILSMIPVSVNSGDGECIHTFVIKLGLESHSLVATSLLDMYLKRKAVRNARRIFHGLHDKNEVSWLVMVTGLALNGFLGEAVSLVGRMLLDLKLILDSAALATLVSVCTDAGDFEHGKWLHTYIIKTGLELDAFLGTSLLDMYAKLGSLDIARHVFEDILEPNLVSWNAIIHAYARLGFLEDVVELYWQLKQAGLSPDSITIRNCFLALASSAGYQRESKMGECFHGFIIKGGFFDSEIATANSLLGFYSKIGDLKSAETVFLCIGDRKDTISWNSLISGYVRNGSGKEAIMLFHRMQLASKMPDSFTLSSILAASAFIRALSLGQCIHAYLIKLQDHVPLVPWDSFVGTGLVDMYAKCGEMESAYKVFKGMMFRDTATWNAIVTGFGQNGYASEALVLFSHQLKAIGGSFSSESATATAVSAYSQLGWLGGGMSLHGFALRKGMESHVIVGNAILSMYSKCGAVKDAEFYFERIVARDTTTWTAMIAGYGINGRVEEAVSMFEKMTSKDHVKPNEITFLEVLWACSHGGLVKEGWSYFQRMRRDYGIEGGRKHYCCMVDLLARNSYLYEAYVLIRSMKVKADAAVWGALLGACRVHGELELGEIAGEELSRAEGSKSDYGVLLSNTYAAVGWWEAAAGVREKVRNEGWRMNKEPGWSRIEVKEAEAP